MASKKKLLQAAAGSAGGAGLDVDEVFSTFVYRGTSSSQAINNGLDLSNEGGLVWIKNRSDTGSHHMLYDTAKPLVGGKIARMRSSTSGTSDSGNNELSSFNSNGFTMGGSYNTNDTSYGYASWSFRKAPKFFDLVYYTGNSGSDRAISHSLGSVPGMIIVKRTNASEDWAVWHREVHANSTTVLYLNQTGGPVVSNSIFGSNPTSTDFYVGNHPASNNENDTYVAYIFAHNNGDGDFGPDGDADIIKCGSYSGNGNSNGPTVNLGFEPQWLLIKGGANDNWFIADSMRGINAGSTADPHLLANTSDPETIENRLEINPTGFKLTQNHGDTNGAGDTHIYMAIRRGSLNIPENATNVFGVDTDTTGGSTQENFKPHLCDMAWFAKRGGHGRNIQVADRVRGFQNTDVNSDDSYTSPTVLTNANDSEFTSGNSIHQTIKQNAPQSVVRGVSSGSNFCLWSFKRAPSYFDIVAYDGTSSAQNITHNLGVKPEMMWIKSRSNANSWIVYHKQQGATKRAFLHSNQAFDTAGTGIFNNTEPTATQFTVGTDSNVNYSGHTFISYLFATAAGVSKVGSYTGNGGTQNIDCGFSSGARFVLIKSSTQATEWFLFDTARGIVSGNDPALLIDTTDGEYSYDFVDPYNSGFAVNYVGALNGTNTSGQTYIFYAIA